MVAWRSGVHVSNALQRPRLPTIYRKRKRRSLGTHRSLQLARDVAEKEKRGGGTVGAGVLPNWGIVEEKGKDEGKGEEEGEMRCSCPWWSWWWRGRGESVAGQTYL
jgi:hypothetical protein